MSAPEHTVISVILENVAAIVTGATVILLALLSYLGKGKQAKYAKAILTETPVSHAELLKSRMESERAMRSVVKEEFRGLKREMLEELRILHKKQNNHVKDYHTRSGD